MPEMPVLQLSNPRILTGDACEAALQEIGLSTALLSDVGAAAARIVMRASSATKPRTAFGIEYWINLNDLLAQALNSDGWKNTEISNAVRHVASHGHLSLGTLACDDAVGDPSREPRNLRRKGAVLAREVKGNGHSSDQFLYSQGELFEVNDAKTSLIISNTYFLLHHLDRQKGILHLEVAIPLAFEDGYVTLWGTRMLIPHINLQGPAPISIVGPQPDSGTSFAIGEA